MDSRHAFGSPFRGHRISPYLQYLMAKMGTYAVFAHCEGFFEDLLRLPVSAAQVYRVTRKAGEDVPEAELYAGKSYAGSETVYAMADGSMVQTDDGWREIKVLRVFGSENAEDAGEPGGGAAMAASEYCAVLGDSGAFIPKADSLLAGIPEEKLVFVGDGAVWMARWQTARYPKATHVLDFFHAAQHLAAAVEGVPKEEGWFGEQKGLLLDSRLDAVLANIGKLAGMDPEKKQGLRQYYENNRYRMDYSAYRKKGYHIGSGAVEAAHKTLIQKRMKLSGQRWGTGGKPVIKLRVAFMSKKEYIVQKLFQNAA